MSEKLARAQHIKTATPATPTSPDRTRGDGKHAGIDRTTVAKAVADAVVPLSHPQRPSRSSQDFSSQSKRSSQSFQSTQGRTSEAFEHDSLTTPDTSDARAYRGKHVSADFRKSPAGKATDSRPYAARPDILYRPAGSSDSRNARRPLREQTLDADIDYVEATTTQDPLTEEIEPATTVNNVSTSAGIISLCVIISRITGFIRTWAMAFALGATFLSSSYQVANNLPNQLYELVAGGMIVTAFLPVYISVQKKLGQKASNEYASNLLTIVVLVLGILSLLCILFPSVVIFTQTFYSDQQTMNTSTVLFQYFAIQIVFYGASAIISGLLNANRDYLWSSIAPVANNLIVITTFILYAFVASDHPIEALYIIALGNPLGVLAQMVIQIPALKRNGIHLRPYINLHDPALKETLQIGIPAVLVMLCSFAVVSVQNAASYSFADNGPSVLAYSRLWFTLPYAFLAVPITTAMFTELASMQAAGDIKGMKEGILSGTNQIIFFMIPFAFYLVIFAYPLITLYHAGAFTMDSIDQIANYLRVLAFALPVYAVNTYLQKIFSSLRKMWVFAGFNFIAGAAQIAITMAGASYSTHVPIEVIAIAEISFYIIADVCLFIYLRRYLGHLGLKSMARALISGIIFGLVGALGGAEILFCLGLLFGKLSGSIIQALLYVITAGLVSLLITFGLAILFRIPEAAFISTLARKVLSKFGH